MATAYRHDNAARGSLSRGGVELTNALALLALSNSMTAAGIAIGTTTTKVKTVNTLTFRNSGQFFSKAATDDFWTLSGTVVPVSSWQKYVLLIAQNGGASIQEATPSQTSAAVVSFSNVSGVSAWAPLITILNTGKTIVGTVTVATDASTTFTPGTTALNAAGITATYADGYDSALLPVIGNEKGLIIGAF